MVIMNDLEQSMDSYYVIYFEKFRKNIQQTEKEALTKVKYCYHLSKGQSLIIYI